MIIEHRNIKIGSSCAASDNDRFFCLQLIRIVLKLWVIWNESIMYFGSSYDVKLSSSVTANQMTQWYHKSSTCSYCGSSELADQ